ncbi:hypothetical protein AB832_07220 [Flavobacteriaceae bacterium (ex Bugula neritina AB1)]|nr:hypothetical protein AB832_07220 [Flavobacteriaceae bacterium (ex Bugula neritina AB1)]
MLESKIEAKVTEYAKKQGLLVYKFTSPNNKGVPDRIFIYKGNVFFIEFKSARGRFSKLQKFTIEQIKNNSIAVYTVRNVQHGIRIIKNYVDREKLY